MKKNKIDYANWVPKKLLILLWSLTSFFLILSILNLLIFKVTALNYVFLILFAGSLFFAIYMTVCHRLFSFEGGMVMKNIHDYLIGKFPKDFKGNLLDIGCGSGALSIAFAKEHKDAKVTGVDYWGIEWDYKKEMCENNARLEKVENIEFVKGDAAKLPFADESFDGIVSNFVFHEVRTVKDKKVLIKEALRVLKKGSPFVIHDMLGVKSIYGDMNKLIEDLKKEGVSEIIYENNTENLPFIPKFARTPLMLKDIGLIYGIK